MINILTLGCIYNNMSKKYIISENQLEILKSKIQDLINSSLNSLREESEEWGLGEMEQIQTLSSVDSIVVEDVIPQSWGFAVNVVFVLNEEFMGINSDSSYQDLRAEVKWRLNKWIPNLKLFIVDYSQPK
jgi:hypothetical protein